MTLPLALGGLASGLDTDAIVSQLMSVERQPRTRLALHDTQAQSRQTQLRDVQTKLRTLYDAAGALRNLTTWGVSQPATSSDSERVTARVLSSAATRAHALDVTQIATTTQKWYTYTPSATQQSIQVGSVTVDINANSSVGTVAEAINAKADAPVSALVADGKLVLTSRNTGTGSDFTATSSLLGEVGSLARAAVDAKYKLDNGTLQTSTSNVITDAVNGLELTLKATTTDQVTVTIGDPGLDAALVKSKVQAFVTAYNGAADLIRGKLAEKPINGATTTTDATKGMFFGDPMLTSLLSGLRKQIAGLSDLGISTGALTGAGEPNPDAIAGRLTLDSTALSAAIASTPTAMKARLTEVGQAISDVVKPPTPEGKKPVEPPVDARLESEATRRRYLASSMLAMDVRLAAKEKRLRAQFAAMESALAAAQAAQARMTAQLGALD